MVDGMQAGSKTGDAATLRGFGAQRERHALSKRRVTVECAAGSRRARGQAHLGGDLVRNRARCSLE